MLQKLQMSRDSVSLQNDQNGFRLQFVTGLLGSISLVSCIEETFALDTKGSGMVTIQSHHQFH